MAVLLIGVHFSEGVMDKNWRIIILPTDAAKLMSQ